MLTTSLNYGRYLEECIQSVINLETNFPRKVNHIIVDGGSTDNTAEILHKYKDHVYFEVNTGEGQTPALNHGMRIIDARFPTTNYLGWLNADDYYNPCWLQASLTVLEREPPSTAMTCGWINQRSIPEHLKKKWEGIKRSEERSPPTPYIDSNRFRRSNALIQPTVLIRMNALRTLEEKYGFYFNPEIHFVQDMELWCRFTLSGYRIRLVRRRVATVRRHPLRLSNTHIRHQKREGMATAKWFNEEAPRK